MVSNWFCGFAYREFTQFQPEQSKLSGIGFFEAILRFWASYPHGLSVSSLLQAGLMPLSLQGAAPRSRTGFTAIAGLLAHLGISHSHTLVSGDRCWLE